MIRNSFAAIAIRMSMLALLTLSISAHGALIVTKTLVSPAQGQANVGELVNFQVSISNSIRSLNVVSLAVADVYTSSALQFVSAEPPPSSVNAQKGRLDWADLTQALGDLAPGRTFTISVTFRAIAPVIGSLAGNTVTVSGIDAQGARQLPSPVSATVQIVQACPPDPYEPNNEPNLGKSIGLNQTIRAYICPLGDVDFFYLSLKDPGIYFIRLFDLPADFNLRLRDAQGVLIGQSTNTGTQPESIKFEAKTSGRWSIEVLGNRAFSNSRPYRLSVTQPVLGGGLDAAGQVEPGGRFVLQGEGLPPGNPASPNRALIYLDKVASTNLLTSPTILPTGRLGASVTLPPTTSVGAHEVITRIVSGASLVEELRSPITATLFPGSMELWVDDAWTKDPALHMPVVNKLVPELNSSYGRTRVDVNCRFKPSSTFSGTSVKFRIRVLGDKFGVPAVYVRTGFGGALTPVTFVNEGGGYYSAVISGGSLASKHCVFKFRVPAGLSTSSLVEVTAETRNVTNDTRLCSITTPRKIRLTRGFSATIFLNRTTLFRDMDDAEVADLLAELHIHSQDAALFGPHDKRATIYCVDDYLGTSVDNWTNTAVSYTSEFNANSVARTIWLLMQEVMLQYASPSPFYLMIVGNDEQFPFYRMNDPCDGEIGWVTNPSGNPSMMATSKDFYFTDNYYGNFLDGTVSGDWDEGNMDLVVGRIMGDGALDMKEFFLNGIMHNGDTHRLVMASVDGWELGYEADDNRAGEIDDYLNVPGRLASRGFGVYNDGETPRTIDAMGTYPSNWSTGFKNAANAGMDLFFIGGHNGYDGAGLPVDGFDPSDTPSKYTRFDDDNPIVMIVGCHGGLPVPNIGGWPGGAGTSMVYDVIRSGARAYYGASGYSYGSPGNLHACLWGELLLQHNFGVLTQNSSYSTTLGYAVRQGKINFPFGVGSNNALDRKTVTEFNLFGVPWQRLSYPGQAGAQKPGGQAQLKPEPAPGMVRERKLLLAPRAVAQLAPATYQQTFHIHTASATPAKLNGFDIINVPGGEQQFAVNTPVLPALSPHSIALPAGGSILGVSVSNPTTTTLGKYEIPTAAINPWTASGITLSNKTNINYLYPRPQAEMREGGQSHYLLTVFPVRHNPTTNDTLLNKDFDVTVTYQAPVPYGILNFEAGSSVYGPGAMPAFSADVFNMGSAGLTLGADLAIWNDDTNEGITTQSMVINLVGGAVYPLLASGTTPLEPGRYGARLRVWSGSVSQAAAAVTEFEVKSVVISDLKAVYNMATGLVAFSVKAANLGGSPGTLALAFAISEGGNLPLDAVSVTPVVLKAGEQVSIPGVWNAKGKTSARCLVEAVAAFDGAPANSAQAAFTPFTKQSLLNAILDHLLGRKLLLQSERVLADLNRDNVIDAADVVAAVNELHK